MFSSMGVAYCNIAAASDVISGIIISMAKGLSILQCILPVQPLLSETWKEDSCTFWCGVSEYPDGKSEIKERGCMVMAAILESKAP